jgi:uncharacterized surface protein with fasciclin (FAS1) repeats
MVNSISPLLLSFAVVSLVLPENIVSGQNLTFREVIESNPDFSIYSTLVQALDDAAIDFADFGFPVTLFAPSNDAFVGVNSDILLSPNWRAHLVNLLEMHLVEGAFLPESLVDRELPALNGQVLNLNGAFANGAFLSSPNTFNAFVSPPEIPFNDGVFYQLDGVLLPAYASVSVLDVFTKDDFSIFNELLYLTGYASFVFNPFFRGTVFAPNNGAFEALGVDALAFYRSNRTITRALVAGHIFRRVVPSAEVLASPVELTGYQKITLIFKRVDGLFYVLPIFWRIMVSFMS